jgi:transposase-like protein
MSTGELHERISAPHGFGLSYRDVEELLAERGIQVDHVTIHRWVLRFTPLLAEAARPCRHAVGDRWYADETYVKAAGQWRYIYRAIDQFGQVIDVFVSARRDVTAARWFFERAIGTTKVTPSLPLTRAIVPNCGAASAQGASTSP